MAKKIVARPSSEVIAEVAQNYGVSETDAVALIHFDRTFKSEFNSEFIQASVAKAMELRGGIASEVTEAAKEGLNAVPVLGGLLALFGYGSNKVAKVAERTVAMHGYEALSALSPDQDTAKFSIFVRELAAQIMHDPNLQQDIINAYNKNPEEKRVEAVVTLARKKTESLIDHAKSGEFAGMNIEDTRAELRDGLASSIGISRQRDTVRTEAAALDTLAFSHSPSRSIEDPGAENVVELSKAARGVSSGGRGSNA